MRKPPNETAGTQLKPFASGDVEDVSTLPDAEGEGAAEPGRPDHIPERTCILTRTTAARGELIRLALGPDGQVAPDVRAKAPGRGAWIGVDRAALETAQAKGKLKAALARAFKTGTVTVPEDLADRIEAALRQATLDRLGLETRAGHLVIGGEKIETALRRGNVSLLIHASDAGADGSSKLDQALRVGTEGAQRNGLVFPADRTILSLALGRQNVVHAAVLDRAAAARVQGLIARWAAFIGRDAALGPAPAAPGASSVETASAKLSATAHGRQRDGFEGQE